MLVAEIDRIHATCPHNCPRNGTCPVEQNLSDDDSDAVSELRAKDADFSEHCRVRDNQFTTYKTQVEQLKRDEVALCIDFMPFNHSYYSLTSQTDMRECHECLVIVALWRDENNQLCQYNYNYFGGYADEKERTE